ncbi:MAG: response regulator [Candidatus Aminicenantes bacterium]|jgi:signal transduction histidine kinase
MNEKKQNQQPREKKTILIVEDEEELCTSISNFLAQNGYLTISTTSGKEGWDFFKKNKPDIVITDLLIWDLHGFDLTARIRNKNSHIPIIVMSAVYRDRAAVVLKMGANEFLEKPFKFSTLKNTVEDILNKSESERELHRYKNLADLLSKENKILEERLSESKAGSSSGKEDKAVCSEVAHNLKGEFMHIGYSLNEIKETAAASPEIVEECDMIERSLAYSRLLMQRLLNFLDMGSLQREPIELKVLIQKTVALAGPRLPSNIRLETRIPPHLDKTRISANFEQLMAILLEFINNASKVLRPKGGIIEIKLEEKDNRVFIFIKDNGPGIPVEIRNKILKEQVPSKNGGLGLGLYLSGKVIREFNGELQVETAEGKGTTFTITFPTAQEKKEL